MILNNLILAIVFGATTVTFVGLTLYVWKRRDAPGGLYFALLMADGAVFALFNMFQMLVADMPTQLLIAKLTYLGVVPAPVLWLLFNIAYGQRSRQLGKAHFLLYAVPAVVLGLVFTNEWHHLFWTSVAPISGQPGSPLVFEFGPGMWLNIVYSYALMTIGTILLAITSVRTYRRYFHQTATLVLGAMIPYAGNIVYFLWLNKYAAFDPTSITLAITGLIYAWSMFRYRLFDLVPLARDRLVTDMAEGILVLDHRDRIIDVNPAAQRIIASRIAIGQQVSDALDSHEDLLECIRGLQDGSQEVQPCGPGGSQWLDVRVSPLRDNRGQVTGRLVTMHDITRRKLDAQALDETRRNFQTLFNTMDDLLFVVDGAGKIIEINDAVTRRLGYARGEATGMDILDMIPEDERQTAGGPGGREKPVSLVASLGRLQARDGSTIDVETHIVGGVWDGKASVFGISRDITDRKRAEDALRESDEKFRTLAETTSGAICIIQDERFVYANPATARVTGFDVGELSAMRFWEMIDAEQRREVASRAAGILNDDDQAPFKLELRFTNKGGRKGWAEINVGVIDYNRRKALLVTAFDITERKQAEEKIIASLREKEFMLKEIHHRVKNNLQVIVSLLHLQAEKIVDSYDREMFLDSQNRVKSMAMIHEKLYRTEDMSHIDFSNYIHELSSYLVQLYKVRPDKIRLNVSLEPVYLSVDTAIPCGLIVNELVSNCIKHAYPGDRKGTIDVRFEQDAAGYRLSVRDDGVGLPPGLDYRNTTSLGLELVNILGGQINGTLDVQSSPGDTCFKLIFKDGAPDKAEKTGKK